jgi:hypothetical protein
VRLLVSPPEVTLVDERLREDGDSVSNEYRVVDGRIELGVHPGKHRITVRRDGYQSAVWELEAKKDFVRERTIELKPLVTVPDPVTAPRAEPGTPSPKSEQGGVPAGVWVGVAATGALAVAAGVVGGLSLANKSSFDDALAAGDLEQATDLRERGIALNIATDVLIGTSVAAAGITTIFLVMSLTEGSSSEQGIVTLAPSGVRVRF